MYIAGIWGGIPLRGWVGHDASAVLLRDGEVIAGIEEERLRRVKHTRSTPANALAFCLSQAQIDARDVDRFAIGLSPAAMAGTQPATFVGSLAGRSIDPGRLCLVEHHVAHAYKLRLDRQKVLWDICPRRRRGASLTEAHKALAAAVQEALETIVLHVLAHFRRQTGVRRLCFAGGVAHNCSLNGRLAASGLFDEIFVHPAAHDAGTAAGAAAYVYLRGDSSRRMLPLRHVYWGPPTANAHEIETTLRRWRRFVMTRRSSDVCQETAALIAGGAVVGWVQGRSEFGPRALGNRSILADPRPAANKDRINAMVKKREGYRPFAPSVLAERAGDFFDLPRAWCNLDHMLFVVPVRETKRDLLGAVTHVDGTARIQTVNKDTNPRYWQLLRAFEDQTGLPVLLNTSFNNNWEPIVESIENALTCFLTTELDCLVVADWIVTKRQVPPTSLLEMTVSQAPYVSIAAGDSNSNYACYFEEPRNATPGGLTCASVAISPAAYQVLERANGQVTLGELVNAGDLSVNEVVEEMRSLWERRLVVLRPSEPTN